MRDLLSWLPYIAAKLTPKDKNLWVFGAFHGTSYSGNAKYLYQYVNTHHPEIRCVWITRSAEVEQEVREMGGEAYRHNSLQGIAAQLRAGAAFVTHATSRDLAMPCIGGGCVQYQLWHGSPIKKILYDDYRSALKRSKLIVRLYLWLFPWRQWQFNAIAATSRETASKMRSAFGSDQVFVTGYPRNDGLTGQSREPAPPTSPRILYAPTFRGAMFSTGHTKRTDEILLDSGFDPDEIEVLLEQFNATLAIRLHPVSTIDPSMQDRIAKSSRISIDTTPDAYQSLGEYSALISDYSSIIFDYMLTGRPVVNFAFDLEQYRKESRDLYYEYEEISITPDVQTWRDAIQKCRELIESGPAQDYKLKYEEVSRRFNQTTDENLPASRRTVELVKKLLVMDHKQLPYQYRPDGPL